jgi:hypothetical protein
MFKIHKTMLVSLLMISSVSFGEIQRYELPSTDYNFLRCTTDLWVGDCQFNEYGGCGGGPQKFEVKITQNDDGTFEGKAKGEVEMKDSNGVMKLHNVNQVLKLEKLQGLPEMAHVTILGTKTLALTVFEPILGRESHGYDIRSAVYTIRNGETRQMSCYSPTHKSVGGGSGGGGSGGWSTN